MANTANGWLGSGGDGDGVPDQRGVVGSGEHGGRKVSARHGPVVRQWGVDCGAVALGR